jgi:transcriptional regulator GlxA family with amidase domain
MKVLSIVIPENNSNASSIMLTYEVFNKANEYSKSISQEPVFRIQLVGNSAETVMHGGLFTVRPDVFLSDDPAADLIIIPTLDEHINNSLTSNAPLIKWVTDKYRLGAEVASLCTGAFLLAAAGILDGKQCSTHWQAAGAFREMFPGLDLKTEKIITDEQGVYTTGGALSSMNLILYLIEKYYSRETAIYCAKLFEIDLNRNSQSPFTIFTGQKNHRDKEIKKAQVYMENNVGEKINIEELASVFAIDRRSFDRRFKKATANTPAEYLQRIKIEAAKKSLETTRKKVHEVMYDIGYTDTKTYRVVFKKLTGLSPVDYRNKYNKEASVY